MVTLRLLEERDLEFLLEVRNDISTRQFLISKSVYTLEQCKEWYSELLSPYYIIENEIGERIGYFRTEGDQIGCDIHMKYRRKGYARQAYIEYLRDKSFATLLVMETNFAKNLYESLGFKYTGKQVKGSLGEVWLEMEWRVKQ